MTGFLVSEHFRYENMTESDARLVAILLGYALGFGTLTCIKAGVATNRAWGRSRRATIYVIMIWGEIVVSLIFGMLGWLHLNRVIEPSFWLYVSMCTCWSLQLQFLLQIIVNRVSLIMYNQRRASQLKWGIAALITMVNISVYCLWVPARLQINQRFVYLNDIWDRVEKVIYALCDGGLNFWFLYLVKKTLISNGLTKYNTLFRFNACAVVCSLSMDVMLIGAMSIKNNFIYTLFHPVAYIVKLNIELTMADLIAKVASSPQLPNIFCNNEAPFQTTPGLDVESVRVSKLAGRVSEKEDTEIWQVENAGIRCS